MEYEYSIGSVRAREKKLLSSSDIEQMLALKSEKELVRFLSDKGFGEGDTVDELIASNTEKMWKYVKSVAPDMNLFEPFFAQNDVHNLKTVLKGTMSDRDYGNLLISPCMTGEKNMIEAVENRRFDSLPEWLGNAADKAYGLLAETKDARLSDAVIDKAVMQKLLLESKKSKSVFLKKYLERLVFFAEVKIALRAAKTSATETYLEQALCECEGLDIPAVIKASVSGESELIKYLEKINSNDCAKAVALYKKSPSEFEKFVDDGTMKLARELCRHSCAGAEPLLGYCIGCEYDRKTVNIISGGIKTKTSPDKIRERLRVSYG